MYWPLPGAAAEVVQRGREGKGHEPGCAELGQHEHSWAAPTPVRQQQTRGGWAASHSLLGQQHQRKSCVREEMIRNLLRIPSTQSCSVVQSVCGCGGCFRRNTGAGGRSSLQEEVALATVRNEKMPQCSIMAPHWRIDAF